MVVTWRGRDHLGRCLDALAAQTRPHATLVVDNGSDDGTAELIATRPDPPETLRLPRNRGYAGGLAAALPLVRTPFVVWCNDDAAPEKDWLAELEDAMDADPAAAAAGSVLTDESGEVNSAGVRLTADGYGADLVSTGAAAFGFCGGAVLLRTRALRGIRGVPAGFFCYYEDTDTAWRLRLSGWRIAQVPAARATHVRGASTQPGSPRFHRWNERNRLLMLLRCAPAAVAIGQLLRFAAITLALPVRKLARLAGGTVPNAPNFTLRLRCLVLAEVLARLPATLLARYLIGRRATVSRAAVWRAWAGRI